MNCGILEIVTQRPKCESIAKTFKSLCQNSRKDPVTNKECPNSNEREEKETDLESERKRDVM